MRNHSHLVLRSVFFFWLFLAQPPANLQAADTVPGPRHYTALDQAEDCSVYRAVYLKFQQAWNADQQIEVRVRALLQEKRAALENCAREKGVVDSPESSEALAAEVCRTAYREWLAPGVRLQMLREDAGQNEGSLRSLAAVLQSQCGGLNPPTSSLRGPEGVRSNLHDPAA